MIDFCIKIPQNKALTCFVLRVGGCLSVQLVCAFVPVASARLYIAWRCGMRNSPRRDASRRYKNKRERGLGPAHSNQKNTTQQQPGTPCEKPPARDIPSKHKQLNMMSSYVYLTIMSFSNQPTKKRIKLFLAI